MHSNVSNDLVDIHDTVSLRYFFTTSRFEENINNIFFPMVRVKGSFSSKRRVKQATVGRRSVSECVQKRPRVVQRSKGVQCAVQYTPGQ